MSALSNLTPEQQDVVRREVRALLERAEAFRDIPQDRRSEIARGLVNVVAFLADPAGGQRDLAEAAAASSAANDGFQKTTDRLAGKQNLVGKDFAAGATVAGTKAFGELVQTVDFPKFVSGLIEGVFTSIVDSSIRQMEAYGKLLEAVVKSVDQYASDHISLNNARDYLVGKYPDKLSIKISNGQPQLALAKNVDETGLDPIRTELGIKENVDLDEPDSEAVLVQRARLEMARARQQQLATMVLLGINRIIVTDGLINAKVVFDVRASDEARRASRASAYDTKDTRTTSREGGGWFSDTFTDTESRHKTTVSSSVDDTSESKAQLKANLTGEVRVNFRSETFPLQQMASGDQITSLGERAKK